MCPFETRKSKGYVNRIKVYCLALWIRKRMMEITRLTKILVAMGKYILKFPRSITMSPGNFPGKGSLGDRWRMTPATTIIIPMIIKNFAIFKNITQGTFT